MEKTKREASDLKHKVVRDVGLVRLYSLEYKGVPQVKEWPQMHQNWVWEVPNIYCPFRKRRRQKSVKIFQWKKKNKNFYKIQNEYKNPEQVSFCANVDNDT